MHCFQQVHCLGIRVLLDWRDCFELLLALPDFLKDCLIFLTLGDCLLGLFRDIVLWDDNKLGFIQLVFELPLLLYRSKVVILRDRNDLLFDRERLESLVNVVLVTDLRDVVHFHVFHLVVDILDIAEALEVYFTALAVDVAR